MWTIKERTPKNYYPGSNEAPFICLEHDGVPYKEYSPVTTSKRTAVVALIGWAALNNVDVRSIQFENDLFDVLDD